MIAIGERASKKHSTKEFAQRDSSKVQRKKVAEFVYEGTFNINKIRFKREYRLEGPSITGAFQNR